MARALLSLHIMAKYIHSDNAKSHVIIILNVIITISLGGSLMKDLWADLQAGDTEEDEAMMGWSLEQLERELAHLEDDGPAPPQMPPPGMPSAASLVVSHAQERLALDGIQTTATAPTVSAADAWSQSLQNFTALSLEQDFLAADSARKQTTAPPGIDAELLRNVQEYNVTEVATMQAPPGLAPKRPPGMPSPAQKKSVTRDISKDMPVARLLLEEEAQFGEVQFEEPKRPPRRRVPPTPQNSEVSLRFLPPTPQNSTVSLDQPVVTTPLFQKAMVIPPREPPVMQQQPPAMATPPKQQQQQPAWQTQPTMPTRPVYCQPDPAAPPIPSAALESSLMKARDLAYVLHSMLKPILIAGISPDDYDILLWQRRSGRMNSPNTPTPSKNLEKEMESRSKRSKEWTAEHSTLGHTAKSDVSRPRALIAVHTAEETTSAPNKERASLWKARLYVDQGYQAYHSVLDVWRAAPPGTVPPRIQPHMVKLLKCLGVKLETPPSTYTVDKTALSLLLKLPKGQTLLARILEQALLPPNAVQALLPAALSIAVHSPFVEDICNVRLFRAFARVVTTLPNMEPPCLVESVKAVEDPDALKSTARMECIHALLRRGNTLSTQDPVFAPEWTKTEQEFMKLLG